VLGMVVPLALTSLALRTWPLRTVQSGLRRVPHRAHRSPGELTPRRMAEFVHMASASLPVGGNCLHRSVLLWWLLERRGEEPRLCLGARRGPESGTPDFHAWVELDGEVVNDRTDIRSLYAVLERPTSVTSGRDSWREAARTSASTAATSEDNRSKPEG
jgi:hypothetical protein